MLQDIEQRTQACDPTQSFIVQAPAGSGKTELLTQRFLNLLHTVQEPEQIIALTFTRKAANEMRERILHTLRLVDSGTNATSTHQQQTFAFAARALKRNRDLEWQLLQHPGRLRIMTIDALCQMLTHAIPLLEKQVPYAEVTDNPVALYRAAARNCIAHALADADKQLAMQTLLLHLDNRQDKVLHLFCDLLATRDQWLATLYRAKTQSKTLHEFALKWMIQHELDCLRQSIPMHLVDQLISLCSQVANIENDPDSPRYALCNWNNIDNLTPEIAVGLASILLTSQQTLRQAFDNHVGLKRALCPDPLYSQLKAASKELLNALCAHPDFITKLARMKCLPPTQYKEEQWQVLQALLDLLPLLAAHLHLTFSAALRLDFTAIAFEARYALGDEEEPTDLALYLDNHIQHLLVDEFQDTSTAQFQLLTQLVQGWQPGDGRTLFIVGDPMQSIYRFRAAEVGLFLRAKQDGIGPVTLQSLVLTTNFRSTATLVNWVNHHFKTIFPLYDDIASGAVQYNQAVPIASNDVGWALGPSILAYEAPTPAEEAQAIALFSKNFLQDHPTDTIAILVRSRRQLRDIMHLFREQQIPYQGVDIDNLADLTHIRDVWSLTTSLLMPTKRLSWLAFLRSPWCGLTLADLHAIAIFDKNKPILYALSQLENIKNLSQNGFLRAQFIYQVLSNALAARQQHSLVEWILNTLKQLHFDKLLDEIKLRDLEQFWLLLERFDQEGIIDDFTLFQKEFNSLYSKSALPARLKIMTIHKSKGLEFDCVILPSLSSKAPNLDTTLLRWHTVPTDIHGDIVLFSPIKAAHNNECVLYDYLGSLEAQKQEYEQQRLLYVAITRAKKYLVLFDNDKTAKNSFRELLKQLPFTTPPTTKPATDTTDLDSQLDKNDCENIALPNLQRLPIQYYQQPIKPIAAAVNNYLHQNNIPADPLPRLLGIIAHETLEWVCTQHIDNINALPWATIESRSKSLGLSGTALEQTLNTLKTQFTLFFQSPIGQWIIKKHEQEHNEYELLVDIADDIATRIIDRTFYDQGYRWIIDFKTGSEEKSATKHHTQQANTYAECLQALSDTPIKCGLYYLTTGHWIHWEYRHNLDT